MADILDMGYINSLGQLYANTGGGAQWTWPVYDIEVECGLVRIDVCGFLERKTIGDIFFFTDDNGKRHETDDFYLDGERALAARLPGTNGSGVE